MNYPDWLSQIGDRPLLYDVFSGAGGAACGYQQAGFFVVGIDNRPQPRYAGDAFYQMDALEFLEQVASGLWPEPVAIHTSPPCQRYSNAQKIQGNNHPDLIPITRKLLQEAGKPYIIENVKGAPLVNPTLLSGTMFGLKTIRPRLFETNFELPFLLEPPRPKQIKMGRPIKDDDYIQVIGNFSGIEYAKQAMGINWMTRKELGEAIPPAYTRYIGEQLLTALTAM